MWPVSRADNPLSFCKHKFWPLVGVFFIPGKGETTMPKIISRKQWGARAATNPVRVAPSRRRTFVVHYDGGHPTSRTGADVPKGIQDHHQRGNGWSDGGYNFVIDQDGNIYEMRGWDIVGAHAGRAGNVEGIGVQVHIGGSQEPSAKALTSLRWLYAEANKRFGRTLAVRGHKDYMSTECPGGPLSRVVASGLSGGGAAPAPAPKPSTPPSTGGGGGGSVTQYRVNTARLPLNGRSGPGTNYPVTMTAAKNYVLDIVETRNGWAKSTGGHWYSMQHLIRVSGGSSGGSSASSGAGRYRVVTKGKPLNGRSGPGTNYRVTMTAAKGYVLDITETRNGWAKSTGGHWYSMQYLRKV